MTKQRVSDEKLAKWTALLKGYEPTNLLVPTRDLESLIADAQDARADLAPLNAELEGAREAGRRQGLEEALQEAERWHEHWKLEYQRGNGRLYVEGKADGAATIADRIRRALTDTAEEG